MKRALLALALLPAFAFASGCLDCVSGPPVSARGITDAPSSAGALGGFRLDVLVTDGPAGKPLPGAGVVVYWSGKDVGDWQGTYVEVTPGSVTVDPGTVDSTPEAKSVERALSGADGLARFQVPKGRIVGVVAAKEGYTEEWIPAMATGNDEAGVQMSLALFPRQVGGDLDVVWGPGGASTGTVTNDDRLWDRHPLPFANDTAAERAYAARIVELTVEVSWVNGATAAGDLAVGVGTDDAQPALFADEGDNVAAGEQTESATFLVADLEEAGLLGAPALRVGAASDSVYFAPTGMPYHLRVDALLDTAQALYARCIGVGKPARDDGGLPGASVPAWGAIGAVGALGLVALARRR